MLFHASEMSLSALDMLTNTTHQWVEIRLRNCMQNFNQLIINGYQSSTHLESGKLSGTNPGDHKESNSSTVTEYAET